MLRRVRFSAVLSVILVLTPLTGLAAEPDTAEEQAEVSPVIITELQTGAQTASDEFIEIYNQTDEPVDVTSWQVRYLNSTTTDGATTLLATISNADDQPVILESRSYYVLHTESVVLPADSQGQIFTAGLSKTDKTVALFALDGTTCQMLPVDAVAWESAIGTTKGEGQAVVVPSASTNKDKLLMRWRDLAGYYVDSNNNATDFSLSTVFTDATPGTDNRQLAADPVPGTGDPSALEPFDAPDCDLPEPPPPPPPPPDESPPSVTDPGPDDEENTPTIPAGNVGLKTPQLSEILPNPASPQTDAKDEFVELYNPNDASFDLSGYVLESGITTKHRFTFAAGTKVQPKSFAAFFSADTGLTLSNSSGQVRLIDPLGRILVESDQYASAKDAQAWILANGKWQWTTKPTPNALNVVSTPAVKGAKTTSVKKASSKSSSVAKPSANGSDSEDDTVQTIATASSGTPLHPGVLAAVALSALIYGVYEYRRDFANKIYQFRENRAARRAARQKP
jgi:hypothetical protein